MIFGLLPAAWMRVGTAIKVGIVSPPWQNRAHAAIIGTSVLDLEALLRACPVAHGCLERHGGTLAPYLQTHTPARGQATDDVDQVVLVSDGHVIDLQDDIVGLQPRCCRWRVGIDTLYQGAAYALEAQPQRVGRLESLRQLH